MANEDYAESERSVWLKQAQRALLDRQTENERLMGHHLMTWEIEHEPQAIIGPYIVDFLLSRKRLVIEVDGPQHWTPGGREKDRMRDAWLASIGFQVMRIPHFIVADLTVKRGRKLRAYPDFDPQETRQIIERHSI